MYQPLLADPVVKNAKPITISIKLVSVAALAWFEDGSSSSGWSCFEKRKNGAFRIFINHLMRCLSRRLPLLPRGHPNYEISEFKSNLAENSQRLEMHAIGKRLEMRLCTCGCDIHSELNIHGLNIQVPEYSGIFTEYSIPEMDHFVNIQWIFTKMSKNCQNTLFWLDLDPKEIQS